MTELKPCPFCGGEADEYEGDYGNGIYCMMCGAMVGEPIHLEYRTTKRVSIAEAIAAWNTRAAMEFDNWFYLPKPREAVAEIAETVNSFDGEKWTAQQFFKVQEQAAINWAKELDEHIIKRICEVWNSRAERTCKSMTDDNAWCFMCSECGKSFPRSQLRYAHNHGEINYCPNCGAKVLRNYSETTPKYSETTTKVVGE